MITDGYRGVFLRGVGICSEERNFIQYKQLHCDTAQLWNSSIVLQLSFEAVPL